MSKVAIRDSDYGQAGQVVREIFDLFPMDFKNKKVFIKPNLVRAEPPEKAATTHPALLREIAEQVKRRGGAPTIGENGLDVQNLYRVTGVEAACAPYLKNISNAAKLFEIGGYPVPISRAFLEADIFISVPKLKTHVIAGMTCCLKNPFGLLPGNAKSRMHARSGHAKKLTEFFVDLYGWRTPDLNIVDGILAMEGDGPSFGDPRPVGKIIAGKDGVAVDAVCARMIGFENPRGIKLIDLAEKKGLVRFDLDRPEVDGPFQVISGFVHPSSYTANVPGKKSRFAVNPETYLQVWSELGTLRPASEDRLCTRCGVCLPACPSGALSLGPLPRIDAARCASCFCCVEACPEKALTVPMGQELLEKRSRMGM